MREFFKYVFATVVGVILSVFVIFVLCLALLIGLVSSLSEDKKVEIASNSILFLNLDQTILERTPIKRFENLPIIGSRDTKTIGFTDVIKSLKRAKTDDRITCIYINVTAPTAGKATLKEIRDALIDFKKSKKPIIAYSEVYTQDAYYLASVADKVYLNPEGDLEFKGFSSELTFFKGAMEKLGVEAQIIRVGNYKSAVEPFITDKMSDYNRKQVTAYVGGLYDTFLQGISESRKINKDTLFNYANVYKIQSAKDALTYKLIDGLRYKDEILDELRKISRESGNDPLNTVSINDYAESTPAESFTQKNKIAVIFANGDIVGGEGSESSIGSERISRAIRKARLDTSIKAIVLRINSGGGSALASDVMWREVVLAKKVKPVIASFGDVAASGGYYMAVAADSIFVQPNTITGSIGVFGIIPNFKNLLNNKLGITFDGVKTGQYADIMSTTRPLTPAERVIVQTGVNHVYDTFLTRVAEGRKKTKAQIDAIAGGHVWIGTDAIKIGLADRLGSFQDAITAAGKKAKIKEYRVVEYPEKIDPLNQFLTDAKDNIRVYYAKQEFGENYMIYEQMKKTLVNSGIQTRLPYEISVK
ncbi:signal peptide peptidase SppA [Pedobacter duraquae]|uniref:Protease-4 n=1 Tax=Pedobacter duraquae TaxID=425511 RepID=A0A4R6IKX3_9SPHI|nr:signal peptide peptidase SppA [Pedobacter duraquae]TDO22749.1 protease-4 [Pedobacter duraquae]